MKLVHIANSFLPQQLGAALRIYNLLARLPWAVTLYVPDVRSDGTRVDKKRETIDNIDVHRVSVEYHRRLWSRLPLIGAYRTWTQIPATVVRAAEGAPADLIVGHSPPMFGIEALALAKRKKRPYVYDVHNLSTDFARDGRTSRDLLTWPYYYVTERRLLTRSNHIVVLNHALKQRIQAVFHVPDDRFTVVPNGVDADRFSPRSEYVRMADQIRRELGLAGQVIMYAGYHDRINGLPDLARIVPEILAQNPEVRFLFIGQGPEQGCIEELAREFAEKVIHLDSIPHEAMPAYYQVCDLFVIPRPSTLSAETITPIKLLEAMAMGRTVLCSDVGGLAELISDGYNGFLYRKGDRNDLKFKIIETLHTSREEIGTRARQKIVDEYSWQMAAEVLAACYTKVLGGERASFQLNVTHGEGNR